MQKTLTARTLLSYLKKFSPEMEITFGSSKYTARPLIFCRFKQRDEDLLQIELCEQDQSSKTPGQESRKTVGYFTKQLEQWPDSTEIAFGATDDGVSLEFKNLSSVVAINLEQTEEPKYKVID